MEQAARRISSCPRCWQVGDLPHGSRLTTNVQATSRARALASSTDKVQAGACTIGSVQQGLGQANDFFLDGVLHQLGLVVNIQLAHQVELVGLDGLDA